MARKHDPDQHRTLRVLTKFDNFDTNDNNLGDELSNEVEPAGFRLYVGIGTGW